MNHGIYLIWKPPHSRWGGACYMDVRLHTSYGENMECNAKICKLRTVVHVYF